MLNEPPEEVKFSIREEELDIKKKSVKTGEVKWHKELLMEEKKFIVPIMREELVIEKKFIDTESTEPMISTETIRIPLREERVEINKHNIDLEEVKIWKDKMYQVESINTMIKKEVLHLKATEHPETHSN